MTPRFLPRKAAALLALALGCGSASPRPHSLTSTYELTLPGSDGRSHRIAGEIQRARFTVFVFYSESCPCMAAHDARLVELVSEFGRRGVAFLLVDSELDADVARDAREAERRGYPFPLLTDRAARLAARLGAEFATHTVVVDAGGEIRYSGAIDSDKNRIHANANPYLREALVDLLAGRSPSSADREGLGCALRLR